MDKREKGIKDIKTEGLWLAKTAAIAFGLSVFLNSAVVVNALIPTGSMEGTIHPGDRVIGSRLAYSEKDPERFDVVVFKYPDDESILYVKRIVGLPGDVVDIKNGKVYINGNKDPLDDSFIPEPMNGSYGPYQVPENSFFLLGDNRNNSNDSRFWKNTFVKKEQIVGKAIFCYWPIKHIGLIR